MRTLPAFLCGPAILLGTAMASLPCTAQTAPDPARFEALKRLQGVDLEANPALKTAVLKVLNDFRGTPQFVELVRGFKLPGQEAGLLEVTQRLPDEAAGVEALLLVFQQAGAHHVRAALEQGDEAQRAALITALARCDDRQALPLLVDVVTTRDTPAPQCSAAIQGLARTELGAGELLRLAREGQLAESSRVTAALALARARWPALREEASRVLPLPRSGDGATLPTPDELREARGDAARGEQVFRSEQAACSKCHRVGEEGVDFGPALTQIGSKLGKEALFESILDPSAGISFGYEAWSFETREGEEVFGIITSETPQEISVKQQSGVVVRLNKSDLVGRHPQRLSAMPAGLVELMSRQDLFDLVEYLTTLRAPAGP